MARVRITISEEEWQRRKDLGLPVTKPLRYMKRSLETLRYEEFPVSEYEVVARYEPFGTPSIMVTLETGEKIRVLGPFFAEMQKPSFERDMEEMAGADLEG